MNRVDSALRFWSAATTMSLILWTAGMAEASGVGGYFEYGNVDGEIDNADFDANQFGVGVIFDSNLAKDSLFNYRGTFGYRSSKHTFETFFGDLDLDADGFEMNHLLGFGVVRTNFVRVFIGPAIRVGVDVFDTASSADLVNVDFGVGPEIGVNLNVAKNLTLSPWVSYQYHYLVQVIDTDALGSDSFDGDEHVVKVGLSILFRSGSDQFRERR